MGAFQTLVQGRSIHQFLLSMFRKLLPSLIISVACTFIIYSLLQPRLPPSNIIRRRRLDLIGILVLSGFTVSIIGVLLGRSQRLLLIQESFVIGALGLAGLVSVFFPKPPGYFIARYVMTANDPKREADFDGLWHAASFRQATRGGTIFLGLVLLGELVLRTILAYTLPVTIALVVLQVMPIIVRPGEWQ